MMNHPPNPIHIALSRKAEDKDRETFARLLFTGPLTYRLDRIAAMLNARKPD